MESLQKSKCQKIKILKSNCNMIIQYQIWNATPLLSKNQCNSIENLEELNLLLNKKNITIQLSFKLIMRFKSENMDTGQPSEKNCKQGWN